MIRILQANALDLPLEDNSVDLVVTSPPYFALRSYQDGGEHYEGQLGAEATPTEFVDALIATTQEMIRVTKPSGSIWVNLGDKYSGARAQNFGGVARADTSAKVWAQTNPKRTGIPNKSLMGIPWRYALRCIDELGLILRAEVIWSKPNGLPESVTDRVRRSHEQWFHFTLQPRYFSSVDEVRQRYDGERALSRRVKLAGPGATGNAQSANAWTEENPLGSLPGSVWEIPTQPLTVPAELGIDHFAAFPMEWPRKIIKGWSPLGGTVLDPFGGTGTVALVADVLGRDAISVDLSADYCRLAEWRTTDPKERARAAQVEAAPPVSPHQPDLFTEQEIA